MIDLNQAVEIRVNWERVAASPWAGCRLVGRVKSADGQEHEVPHQEANALAVALRAAGARLVESVEGTGRVARVVWPVKVRPRPGTVEEALSQMVTKGKANKPGLAKRLESAAGLVGDGRVALVDETEAQIGPYHITAEACTCPDFVHRGGWCKHRLAVRMARHLVGNGFELPQPAEVEKCPQIRKGDLAKIASGQVIDEARRRELAYRESGHGARDRAMRMLGNGAVTLPAELARRSGIRNYELGITNEDGGRQ